MDKISRILKESKDLSYMNGGDDNDFMNAIGYGDDFLSLNGESVSFQSFDGQNTAQFGLTVTNANVASRTFRLISGPATSSVSAAAYPGLVTTGAFNDITGAAGLSGAPNDANFTIPLFQYYINRNPTRLLYIRIYSANTAQLDQNLTKAIVNPYNGQGSETIRPQNALSQNSQNTNISFFPLNMQLDYLTDLTYTVIGSASVSITLFMGPELNVAMALSRKANNAKTLGKAYNMLQPGVNPARMINQAVPSARPY